MPRGRMNHQPLRLVHDHKSLIFIDNIQGERFRGNRCGLGFRRSNEDLIPGLDPISRLDDGSIFFWRAPEGNMPLSDEP